MSRRRVGLSPLGAVVAGAFAGAVGTAAMDAVWYRRYRRSGGQDGPRAWEFAAGTKTWDDASAPGQVGKRVAEGFVGHELPDAWARPTQNTMHWLTGMGWGVQFGIVAASVRRPIRLIPALGPTAWLASYALLGAAKLYKPIWEYDAKTLGQDLSAHLVFGAATGATFVALNSGRALRAP
jgi:hypothetical protein